MESCQQPGTHRDIRGNSGQGIREESYHLPERGDFSYHLGVASMQARLKDGGVLWVESAQDMKGTMFLQFLGCHECALNYGSSKLRRRDNPNRMRVSSFPGLASSI